MLLDEPTNHLDVYTREALEEALEQFTGALVVVSHDRYFIDRVAENVILVEEGQAEVYSGNYTDLVERFKSPSPPAPLPARAGRGEKLNAAERGEGGPERSEGPGEGQAPPQHVDRAEQRKRDKRIKKIDEEIAQLEERVTAAERERERNEQLLCTEEVFRDGPRVKKIQQQNTDLKAMIDLLMSKWEALEKEKEELESAVV